VSPRFSPWSDVVKGNPVDETIFSLDFNGSRAPVDGRHHAISLAGADTVAGRQSNTPVLPPQRIPLTRPRSFEVTRPIELGR
jgi:hypothetical protein